VKVKKKSSCSDSLEDKRGFDKSRRFSEWNRRNRTGTVHMGDLRSV
jgi:hypothetical protein